MDISTYDETVEKYVRSMPGWQKHAAVIYALSNAQYNWPHLLQSLTENSVAIRSHITAQDMTSSDYHRLFETLDMVSEMALLVNTEWESIAMQEMERDGFKQDV